MLCFVPCGACPPPSSINFLSRRLEPPEPPRAQYERADRVRHEAGAFPRRHVAGPLDRHALEVRDGLGVPGSLLAPLVRRALDDEHGLGDLRF